MTRTTEYRQSCSGLSCAKTSNKFYLWISLSDVLINRYLAMFDFVVCVFVVWFKRSLNTRYFFHPRHTHCFKKSTLIISHCIDTCFTDDDGCVLLPCCVWLRSCETLSPVLISRCLCCQLYDSHYRVQTVLYRSGLSCAKDFKQILLVNHFKQCSDK